MDDIVQRAQFGNMYDWVHKEYFGYFKDMTYVETTDDAICVIRHRYILTNEFWNTFLALY